MKRLLVAVAAATALSLGSSALTATAAPTAPAVPNYLAAGDSITLGLGVTPAQSHPRLLDAKSRRIALAANLGASGATVAELAAQLGMFAAADPAAAAGITKISLTVGANDVGWVQTLAACLDLPLGVRCADLVVPATGLTLQQLVDARLAGLAASLPVALGAVGASYPRATIYVGSYYELFGAKKRACVVPGPGGVPMSISLANKIWFNQTTRRLNAVLRGAVAATGGMVRFVDVAPLFNGHGFCDSARRWVLGPADSAPAHPNAAGQRAYARMFHARGVR